MRGTRHAARQSRRRRERGRGLVSDGSGCGGPIRITDIYGQQLTIDGIALRPNVAQPTGVQFARH